MKRIVALLWLTSACAFAQMQLLLVDAPGSEKPVSAMHSIGSAAVGERIDTVFRVRNASQAALTIRTLTLGGTGFTMFGQPSLPHVLAPGLNMDFTVRFAPGDYGTYSANLTVNGVAVLLTGSSTAAAILSSGGVRLTSGTAVDLGLAERGTTLTKTFRLENTTSERVRVQTASITGAHFRAAQDLPLPLELPARSFVDFDVIFAPSASGVFQGSLIIDGRSYRLTGAANEPPFPKPTIVVDLPNPTSGQQGRVSVHFGQASRAIGSGKLRLEFRPAVAAAPDDEAVRFIKNNRSTPFEVTEGVSVPVEDATFQTGTTAGTITFTAEVGGWTVTSTVEIRPQSVHIEKVKAVKNASMLEVEITGYDNTRSVGQLAFTFYTSKGEPVQPGAIRVDGSNDFRRFFENSAAGGAFTLRAVFPVAGPLVDIASTDVSLANSSGPATSGKIQMQ
jgi:hypothetical protein